LVPKGDPSKKTGKGGLPGEIEKKVGQRKKKKRKNEREQQFPFAGEPGPDGVRRRTRGGKKLGASEKRVGKGKLGPEKKTGQRGLREKVKVSVGQ